MERGHVDWSGVQNNYGSWFESLVVTNPLANTKHLKQ